MLGLFVSVVMALGSIMDNFSFITMPLFLFAYLALFCTIGQHVKDSAAEVREAAYDCEWYAAPIPFRKLILMLLIRCGRESKMDAKPFFEMDFELLMKVMKSAYAIVAVVLNMTR